MISDNPVAVVFFNCYPWLRAEANVEILENVATRHSVAGYREAYARIQHKLCINPKYLQAWTKVLQEFPLYDNQANLMTFVTSLLPFQINAPVDAITPHELREFRFPPFWHTLSHQFSPDL